MKQQELAKYARGQQQARMGNLGLGNIGGALAGLTGGITSAVTIGTANTSGTYTISNAYIYEGEAPSSPTVAAPVKDDEFSWLRKRVDDVCWKQAA